METTRQPLLSVCIPSYEMGGLGAGFLRHSLGILAGQTFKDFEVVVSDYTKEDELKAVCDEFAGRLDIVHVRNTDPRVGISSNTNNALRHARGKLIKLLYQDDFLYGKRSLETVVKNFDLEKDTWLVTACIHTKDGASFEKPHYPHWTRDIHLGNNRLGSPSVVTLRNDHPLLLDYNLKWLVDCDWYRRLHDLWGRPKIVHDVAVAIRTGDHQITNTEATMALRRREREYVKRKFYRRPRKRLHLPQVSVISVSGLSPVSGVEALRLSMRGIDFHEAVMVSHEEPAHLPDAITWKQPGPDDLQSKDRTNTNDYSRFMLYELDKYVDSEFALIVHKNAHVLRPGKWSDEFLQYDYIGAPWPAATHYTPEGEEVRVGNGGFCLRSKKLMRALRELDLPFTDAGTGYFHEDGVICVYYRKKLEEHGIRFAPPEVAARFALEIECPESDYRPFGFHDNLKALPKAERARRLAKRILTKRKRK